MSQDSQYGVELKISATTAEAQSAIKEVDTSLKQFVKNVTGSEAALEDFNDELETSAKDAKKGSQAYASAASGLKSLGDVSKRVETSLAKVGKSLRDTGKSLSLFVTGPLLAAGTLAVANFAKQEEAVSLLNQSLKNAGTFSNEASLGIQKFASALQASSTFGDEVILQNIALARNFTSTNEQATKLVEAAVNLSAATGAPLEASITNLGKTFSGLSGRIAESIPAIRALSEEQLRAGAAIDLVAARFAGSALEATKTFNGQLAQLKNSFGDFLELIGAELAPVIAKLVTNFQSAVDFLNSLDVSTRRTIVVIAAAAAAIGPLLIGLGFLSSALGAGLIAVRIFTGAMLKLLVILAGPVGITIAIVAFGAALAGVANVFIKLTQITESWSESLVILGDVALKGFARVFVAPFLNLFATIFRTIGALPGLDRIYDWKNNAANFDLWRENIITSFGDSKSKLSTTFLEGGVDLANTFTLGLSGAISDGLKTINDSFSELVGNPLAKTATDSVAKVKTDVTKLGEESRQVFAAIGNTAVSSFSSAFASVSDGTKSASQGFKDFASSAVASIQRIILEAALLRALSSAIPGVFGTPSVAAPTPAVATGGFLSGGKIIKRFASGGSVVGPGSGTSDSILARLSNGEFVSDAKTVSHFGADFFTNLKRMARGFNGAPNYSAGMPAFANGGLVSSPQGGETRVVIQNSGSPKETRNVSVEQDAQGTIVSIILEDISRNGNISKTFQNSFGLKRSGV